MYIRDLSGVAGRGRGSSCPGHQSPINFFLGDKYRADPNKGDVLTCCGDL